MCADDAIITVLSDDMKSIISGHGCKAEFPLHKSTDLAERRAASARLPTSSPERRPRGMPESLHFGKLVDDRGCVPLRGVAAASPDPRSQHRNRRSPLLWTSRHWAAHGRDQGIPRGCRGPSPSGQGCWANLSGSCWLLRRRWRLLPASAAGQAAGAAGRIGLGTFRIELRPGLGDASEV